MFLIDLNHKYFKVVRHDGEIWTGDLDEVRWAVINDEPVHVRVGREVAVMPLYVVHQWLFPHGVWGALDAKAPEEHAMDWAETADAPEENGIDWEEPRPCKITYCQIIEVEDDRFDFWEAGLGISWLGCMFGWILMMVWLLSCS